MYLKSKRHILLLEVLIALTILVLSIFPLITPHVAIFQSHKHLTATMQIDHSVNLLFVEVLDQLQRNQIPWHIIQEEREHPIDPAWWDKALLKQHPFSGTYQFQQHSKKESDQWSKYLYTLTFTLEEPSFNKKNSARKQLKFPYLVCIFRHHATLSKPSPEA